MKLAIITTNEERFIDTLSDKVDIVITNNPDSPVIPMCLRLGIDFHVINNNDFLDRKDHDNAIKEKLDEVRVDLVILGGYRRLIKNKDFLKEYGKKMINIHNSFLPNFPGPRPHEEVFLSGIKKSGYTIHYVDSVMDRGDIIMQEEVDISQCENPQEVYDTIVEKACFGVKRVVEMFEEMKVKQSLKSI